MPPGRGRLEGRVALVTGAASGIGAATSRAMVREGARVVVCDIQDALGEALVQAMRDEGGEASYAHLDVARADDWQSACQLSQALYGGVDVLVNNAGVFLGKSFEEATLADWQRLCDVNLTGVVLGIRSLLPTLRERAAAREHGTSAIVNLSSVAGLVGTVQLITVIHDDFGWANPVTDWVSSIGMDQVGFVVVGLFALTWLVAAGVWRLGLAPAPQR